MATALAILTLAAAALATPAPVRAAPGYVRIVQDDALLLRAGPAARAAALDEMAAAGTDVIRVNVVWRRPRWAQARALVAAAHARGLEVLVTLTTPAPDRHAPPHPSARPGTWRPDSAAFGAFAAQARRRLDADRWSLINEPNSPNQLLPQFVRRRPASPGLYRGLARAGLRALAGERVLLGELLAIAGETRETRSPVPPLRFTRAVLRDRQLARGAAGWSVHPYYPTDGPRVRPRDRGSIYPSAFNRLLRVTRGLDVWDTESGVQTRPPERLVGTTLAGQARAINEAEELAWRTPRVRSFTQYLWHDDVAPRGFQSGVRFASGAPKPALAAYRLPLVIRRGGRVWARLPPGTATATLRGPGGLERTLTGPVATARVPPARGTYRVVAGGIRSRKAQP